MSQPAETPALLPNDLEEPQVTDANLWLGSSASYEALANGFELKIPEWFNMADATVGRHARGIFSDRIALVCSSGDEGARCALAHVRGRRGSGASAMGRGGPA